MSLWAFSERYISFALRQHLHCLVIFAFIDIKQVNQTSLAVLFSSHGPSWISQYIIVNRISLCCVRTAVFCNYYLIFHLFSTVNSTSNPVSLRPTCWVRFHARGSVGLSYCLFVWTA